MQNYPGVYLEAVYLPVYLAVCLPVYLKVYLVVSLLHQFPPPPFPVSEERSETREGNVPRQSTGETKEKCRQ
jgi:hypothetical protein